MAVPGRNRTVFHCVFRPLYWRDTYVLFRLIRHSCILAVHMNHTLNGSFVLQFFEHDNKLRNRYNVRFVYLFIIVLPTYTLVRTSGYIFSLPSLHLCSLSDGGWPRQRGHESERKSPIYCFGDWGCFTSDLPYSRATNSGAIKERLNHPNKFNCRLLYI